MFGLTPTGFVSKDLETIRTEMTDELTTLFGASAGRAASADTTAIGQLVGSIAERFALLWQLAEAVNSSQDPDKAVDTEFEALAALTGTIRNPATESNVTLTLTGDDATLVPSLSQASEEDTGSAFQTIADATISAVGVWVAATAYAIGDRRENDTPDRVYECTVAGISAGSGGPTGTGTAIVDGAATWNFLGDGVGAVDAPAQASVTGPVIAVSRKITVIDTPVAGWNGVINNLDADLGADIETTAAMRVRREVELSAAGTSPVDAIRTALLKIKDVTTVNMFVNNTDNPVIVGGIALPPHSVEALIQGGADQDIFDALLANVAAGIQTFGSTIGASIDSEGNSHVTAFSRPTLISIYVGILLTFDVDLYPTDGDAQVKAAIVAKGDLVATGKDVIANQVKSWTFGVAGVLNPSSAFIGIAPAPASELDVAISIREIAKYDTSRITVSSSAGTP